MAKFTITIEDKHQLAGITAARIAYNSSIPATIVENETEIANPDLLETDADYVQFVMRRAAESYAKQYGV